MSISGRKPVFRVATGLLALGLLTPALSAPASAAGLFESLFGGFRRAVSAPSPPPNAQGFVDPFTSLARALNPPPQQPRAEGGGPSSAFCVRTCDGHYFPVRANPGLSAAEACHSFCPASQTKLYSGGSIDHAMASDGSRYADLRNAFAYRKQIVAGCTCNGKTAFGLAPMDPMTDPTLRQGDVVATRDGLMAYSGGKNRSADFTPVGSYSGFGKNYREQLSDIKLMPPTPGEQREITSSIASPVPRPDANLSARAER